MLLLLCDDGFLRGMGGGVLSSLVAAGGVGGAGDAGLLDGGIGGMVGLEVRGRFFGVTDWRDLGKGGGVAVGESREVGVGGHAFLMESGVT